MGFWSHQNILHIFPEIPQLGWKFFQQFLRTVGKVAHPKSALLPFIFQLVVAGKYIHTKSVGEGK